MRKRTKWILGVCTLLAVAAPSSAQVRYRSDYRIPTSKEPMPLPEPSRIDRIDVKGSDTTIVHRERMPVRAFRLEDYLGLTEPQLAGFMITRDSSQITMAQLAQQKVTDPEIRAFAANVEMDRTRRLSKTLEMIGPRDHIGVARTEDDYERTRRREIYHELQNMKSGPEFDAAYLQTQFFLDQNEIEVLHGNLDVARDNDFRRHVKKSVTQLGAERDTARNLAQARNISLP